MLNKLIYRLTKIIANEYADDSDKNIIECSRTPFGFFDSRIHAQRFIVKHNHDNNCFFILKTYILNPVHGGQSEDNLTEISYDAKGNVICECQTHHFIVNYNELNSEKPTIFRGRNDHVFEKKEEVWMYDRYDNVLIKCIVGERPYRKNELSSDVHLDWYDDSYLLYPINNKNNHIHALSCYVFSDEDIHKMIS